MATAGKRLVVLLYYMIILFAYEYCSERCGMQPRELLKLAVSGYFQVLKISKGSDGLYVLKRCANIYIRAWGENFFFRRPEGLAV